MLCPDDTPEPADLPSTSPEDLDPSSWSRYACYEGADRLPGLPPRLWYRVAALLWWRGEHTHPALKRMLKHLVHHADEHGVLRDIPAILVSYSGRHAVGPRTGWNDLERACQAGLLRQLKAAAPGRQASYILAMDVAALPADLPEDMRAALRRYVDNPASIAKGAQTRAEVHRALADCQVVRYGSARRQTPIMESVGCGRLHTSPFTREGSPPSPQPRQSQPSQRARRLPFGGQDLNEERSRALDFVKGLCPVWAYNRASGEIPSDAELAKLAPLVGLLLRRMPGHEVAELLTTRIGTASDLAGVLRWRIGRTLGGLRRAERRSAALRVDDDGAGHAAWLAANAAAAEAQAASKAAVVELARRRAEEVRRQREEQPRPTPRPAVHAAPYAAQPGDHRIPGEITLPGSNRALSVALSAAVDDDGAGHAAWLAANAAAAEAQAASKAAVVELARRRAEEVRRQREEQPRPTPRPRPVVRPRPHLYGPHNDQTPDPR
uniref:hypothetical protein n=1 Tax=Sphaerisporangium sp. CA-236357 TaxID=3240030 RepID=UPI003F49A62B